MFDPNESTAAALAQAWAWERGRDEPTEAELKAARKRVIVWNDWREVIGLEPFP